MIKANYKKFRWDGVIIILVTMLLIYVITIQLPSEPSRENFIGYASNVEYPEFGTLSAGFSMPAEVLFASTDNQKSVPFTINDHVVYKTAYISINGSNWTEINLTGNNITDKWIKSTATGITNIDKNKIPTNASEENYIIFYSCSRTLGIWNCHDKQWQIKQFKTNHTTENNNTNSSGGSGGGPGGYNSTCSGSNNRSCNITNGTGIQYRTCTNGNWTNYGTCTMTSCNAGYHNTSNTCVQNTIPSSTGAIIADHNAARDFDNIPVCWLEKAKEMYSVTYHHTSHGSQIVSGINYLRTDINLTLYDYMGESENSLSFMDNYDTDLGNGNWAVLTRNDLNANPSLNNAMWSWCGQVGGYTTYSTMSSHYLAPAEAIVNDYPNVDFVYMTGHLDGGGPTGSAYVANNIIRQHVRDINGTLFDFADIESYDLAGNYYPSESDACVWCDTWCNNHPQDCVSLPYSCAHSHPLNCLQKGRAYWWMLARMAGWDGVSTTCDITTCSGANNRSCNITNGTGIQFRNCTNGNWSNYGICNVTSCNSGYTICGNGCNVSSRTCAITNGIGNQTGYCSSGTWNWNTCAVTSCNNNYFINGTVCSSTTCFGANNRTCTITNGTGIQYRTCSNGNWSGYGTCTMTSCNAGYHNSSNTCVADTPMCGVSDGICSSGCTYPTDVDCDQCTTATTCPTGTACQTRTCTGTPRRCGFTSITSCTAGDSCCPSGCTSAGGDTDCSAPSAFTTIIVNHTHTNISKVPISCINKAKTDLHIAYSHTSHGSQIYSGMNAVRTYNSLYAHSSTGGVNTLHFEDYYGYGSDSGFATGGCYDLSACDNGGDGLLWPTRTFLDSANGQDINVIMWSWCAIGGHNMPFYLSRMQTAITEYENGKVGAHTTPVKFVFMTGHAEGGGENDASATANRAIRNFIFNQSANAFCKTHQCILFDFADIENYDPDNNYFLNKSVTEALYYSGGNWGTDYFTRHPTGVNYDLTQLVGYGCAHSADPAGPSLTCALKGQAVWYMFARIAGWDGVSSTCN